MTEKQAWRRQPMTIEQWKTNCAASSHVRKGETLTFHERENVVSCGIEGTMIFLGAYFIAGDKNSGILPNTGWNHE